MIKKLLGLLLVLILTFFVIRGWWNSQLEPVNSDTNNQVFVIAKGAGLNDISSDLQKAGLIKSAQAFKLYVKQHNLADKIQAGTFKLSPAMSASEIAISLTDAPLDVWVTLLEGWRVEEMANKLNGQLKIDNGEFLKKAKEGYMFPDTYLFAKDVGVEKVVQTLRENFEDKYSNDLRNKIKKLGLTPEQGVILASIVEREARSDEVRRMVASILLKRFKIDMGLNADATIQYALGYQAEEKSWWKRHLSLDDLKIKSPYNTYIHAGLPPAPISNPSLSSLQAVAKADPSTPYLYYYHDLQGNSYYAKTLDEHNNNVANHP